MRTTPNLQLKLSSFPQPGGQLTGNAAGAGGVTTDSLVDCGRASEVTRGGIRGFFQENAPPPLFYYAG